MEEPGESSSEHILQMLASPGREPITLPTVLIVAHPDDETLACGGQLSRFADIRIVHVTDGAPRRGSPPAYAGWEAYRDVRAAELRAAVALAGIPEDRLISLGWPDQEASLHLSEIAKALVEEVRVPGLVITHAYEGGHPDHDATAFAVHAACWLAERDESPTILEVPLYRAGPSGWIVQRFEDGPGSVEVALTPNERALKGRMLAAHHSQREMLTHFETDVERFRPAKGTRFDEPPNSGQVHYDRMEWGLTSARWWELAAAASRELGFGDRLCP